MPEGTCKHKKSNFADVSEWKSATVRSQRVIFLLAGCAALCIGGLTTPVALSQVGRVRPRIAEQLRIEHGIRDLGRMSPADRSESIRLVRDSFAPTHVLQERKRKLLDAIGQQNWTTFESDGLQTRGGTVFLDVKNKNGRVSVGTRRISEVWLQEMELENSTLTWQPVNSAEDLQRLLGDATTVVHNGDSLPEQWGNHHLLGDIYLRNSNASPKETLYEYIRAAEILDRKPQPGKVRILSALPQSASHEELRRMGLRITEASGWQGVENQMSQLQLELFLYELGSRERPRLDEYHLFSSQSHRSLSIETATKEKLVEELANGSNDSVVLIAHFDGSKLHFPDGRTMTRDELAAIKRDEAPERNLVLISCEAGSVNEPVESLAEIALRNKLAMNVVAPPQPVSAAPVPDLLRSYLIDGKSIKDVFVTHRNFNNITENLHAPRYPVGPFWMRKQEAEQVGLSRDS